MDAFGQMVGPYRLLKRIAAGGMGEVFLASQIGPEGFQKVVVLKRMLPNMASDHEFIRLFLDEARLVAKLAHRNIAQIFELGESDDGFYVVMEHVKGPSVRKLMDQIPGRRVPPALAIDIASQVADALAYAFNAVNEEGTPLRIVHRDVTPENILISVTGDVKLIDFGVAKSSTQEHATQAGAVKGKLAYMSPEQSKGRSLDGRSDLFSLGIVLCELLSGKNPFARADVLATVLAMQSEPPRLPSADDPALEVFDPLLEQVLAKKVEDRLPDAGQFYEELQALRPQVEKPPKRLGPFVTDYFGKEVAALIKSVTDPDAQRALRASTGMADLLTPNAGRTPATSSSRHSTPARSSPRAQVRQVAPEEIEENDIAATLPPGTALPDATPDQEPIDHAGTMVRPSLAEPKKRKISPLIFVAGGIGVVAVAGVLFIALREPAAQAPPAAPLTQMHDTPPPPSAEPAKPPAPPLAKVAEPAPTPTIPVAPPIEPKVTTKRNPEHPVHSRPSAGKASGEHDAKTLAARYRRIKAAWDEQRAAASTANARVFDAALSSIQQSLSSGTPQDLADAKGGMDDFVKGALRGVEP
jgi:eukaryotic-like serine/threonine-protein kinase